jgi:hypothetical protein
MDVVGTCTVVKSLKNFPTSLKIFGVLAKTIPIRIKTAPTATTLNKPSPRRRERAISLEFSLNSFFPPID